MTAILTRHLRLEAREVGEPLGTKFLKPASPDRVRRFSISTDDVDRYNDVVLQTGIDFAHYRSNPVILLNHDSFSLPIGRAVGIEAGEKETLMDVEFTPEGKSAKADEVLALLEAGFIRAGSIGFIAKNNVRRSQEPDNELFQVYPTAERIITAWELLEFSIVTIPANPRALAKSIMGRFLDPTDPDDHQNHQASDHSGSAPGEALDFNAVNKALNELQQSMENDL